MAQAALGRAYYSPIFNRPDLGREHFAKALAAQDRLTMRERLLIEAEFAAARRADADAKRLYTSYLALYPNDTKVLGNLAMLHRAARDLEQARAGFARCLELDPNDAGLLIDLAVTEHLAGRAKDSVDYYVRAFAIDGRLLDRPLHRFQFVAALLDAGQVAQARVMLEQSLDNPTQRARALRELGLFEQRQGHFRAAASRFREAVAAGDPSADGLLSRARDNGYLAGALTLLGERAEALRALDRAKSLLRERGATPIEFRVRLARAEWQLGRVDRADLDNIRASADQSIVADRISLQFLAGEEQLARGDAAGAVKALREAAAEHSVSRSLILSTLALAQRKIGDERAAVDTLRKILDLEKSAWPMWEGQIPWLLAHLDLAKLHLSQGDQASAAQVLSPLLEAWRSADDQVPIVREARRVATQLGIAIPSRS